ncbi:MAG TPA: hypothetical protein VES19_12420 [Candidatus Limnocylindrales bacterium]|nr:hypothetical protein [Candidatus Limnocylindrales bacterium]
MPDLEVTTHAPARARDVAPARAGAPGPGREAGRPGYVDALLGLQAAAGNQAVVRLLHEGGAPPPGVGVLASGAWKFGRHPDFPASMGQTWYAHNDIGTWPSFNLEYSRSIIPPFDHQARPKTTDPVGAAWPVLATPENEDGYKMPESHPDHPGLGYYIRVSGTAANNIAAAEQQHVNDLDEGWNLTGRAAKKAINQAAGEDWSEGDDMAAAKAAAIDKVVGYMGALGPKVKSTLEGGGSLEPAIGSMMDKSFTQSKSQRDGSGKHTIPVVYVTTDADQTKVLYEADPNKAPDTTATSTVVNLGSIS